MFIEQKRVHTLVTHQRMRKRRTMYLPFPIPEIFVMVIGLEFFCLNLGTLVNVISFSVRVSHMMIGNTHSVSNTVEQMHF